MKKNTKIKPKIKPKAMDKVKIKRVKRIHKKTGTKEKVLAALGVGSTLLGGAGAVSARPETTKMVSTNTNTKSSAISKVKQTLKDIFDIKEAKADDSVGAYSDADLIAGINSIPYTNNQDFPDSQLQRINSQITIPADVNPSTVLAYMLGLGGAGNIGDQKTGNDGKTYTYIATGGPVGKWSSAPVVVAPVTVTAATLATATIRQDYSATISATGGTGPYTFVATGLQSSGLTLNSNGTLTGTPGLSPVIVFSVVATDSAGNASPSQSFTISSSYLPVAQVFATATVTPYGSLTNAEKAAFNHYVSLGEPIPSTFNSDSAFAYSLELNPTGLANNTTKVGTNGKTYKLSTSAGTWTLTVAPATVSYTIEQVITFASSNISWGQLTPDQQTSFNQYFSNGQNSDRIPTSFGASGAFAYALGLGNSSPTGTDVGANGQTYKLQGTNWVLQSSIDNLNYTIPSIGEVITRATNTAYGHLNDNIAADKKDFQAGFDQYFGDGKNTSQIPLSFGSGSAFAYALAWGDKTSDQTLNSLTYHLSAGQWAVATAPTYTPLKITTSASLAPVTAGQTKTYQLAATGGLDGTRNVWEFSPNPLLATPASWITVSTDGIVSATPPASASGSYDFTARVKPYNGSSDYFAEQKFTVTVSPATAVASATVSVTITHNSLPVTDFTKVVVGDTYNVTLHGPVGLRVLVKGGKNGDVDHRTPVGTFVAKTGDPTGTGTLTISNVTFATDNIGSWKEQWVYSDVATDPANVSQTYATTLSSDHLIDSEINYVVSATAATATIVGVQDINVNVGDSQTSQLSLSGGATATAWTLAANDTGTVQLTPVPSWLTIDATGKLSINKAAFSASDLAGSLTDSRFYVKVTATAGTTAVAPAYFRIIVSKGVATVAPVISNTVVSYSGNTATVTFTGTNLTSDVTFAAGTTGLSITGGAAVVNSTGTSAVMTLILQKSFSNQTITGAMNSAVGFANVSFILNYNGGPAVTAAPAITSAQINYTTGILTITGTNLSTNIASSGTAGFTLAGLTLNADLTQASSAIFLINNTPRVVALTMTNAIGSTNFSLNINPPGASAAVTLSKAASSVAAGATDTVTVTSADKNVTVTSADPSKVTVSVNTTTGVITLTGVNQTSTGVVVTVHRVADGTTTTNDATITVSVVAAGAPIISTGSLPNGQVGTAYSQTLAARNFTGTVTWSVSGSLPLGLTLDQTTGIISGTPTAVGPSSFTITATSGSQTASANFSVSVTPVGATAVITSMTPTTAAQGTAVHIVGTGLNSPGLNTVQLTNTTTGIVTTITGLQGLPAVTGVQFEFTVPAGLQPGSYAVRVQASGASTFSAPATLTVTSAIAASITTSSVLASGQVGTVYTQNLSASGFAGTVTWSVSSGSLPAGLTLAPGTGIISGTPTAAGSSSFTLSASDGTLNATKDFTISITTPGSGTAAITTATLSDATITVPYSQNLSATGFSGILTWSSSSLPSGLVLNSATGQISGAPTTMGVFKVTISVTDGTKTATKDFNLTIAMLTIIGGLGGPSATNWGGSGQVLGTQYTQPFQGLQMPPGYPASSDFQGLKYEAPVEVAGASISGGYTVKKGDTLIKISQQVYGSGKYWRKILAANPKCLSVPNNTRTLKIGFQLIIPSIN